MAMTKRLEKKCEAFEMWLYLQMLRTGPPSWNYLADRQLETRFTPFRAVTYSAQSASDLVSIADNYPQCK